MTVPIRRVVVAVFIALAMLSEWACAQAPAGAGALSVADAADSLSVLSRLDADVRRNPRDAATWHRRGVIAWVLAERARETPPVPTVDRTALLTIADASLRESVDREPNNALYRLTLGKYLLSSRVSLTRGTAYTHFERALTLARSGADSALRAEAAVEVGRTHWRRYDAAADRWLQTGPGEACAPFTGLIPSWSSDETWNAARDMRDALRQCAQPVTSPLSGEADYLQAETLFREAHAFAPASTRALRQLAMLLAERKRWTELASIANARVAQVPTDAWGWMTLGLATHFRRHDLHAAFDAFAQAFTYLPEEERRRFNRLERIYSPRDSGHVGSYTSAARFATHRLYWLAATPLWSRLVDHPQIEFLARVTYAELRWTVDELSVRGADTDRGDVYIRYGAPDLVTSFRGEEQGSGILTKWTYRSGLVFTFQGQPTFATAQIAPAHQAIFSDIATRAPVRWYKEFSLVVDSMEVQVARFRAAAGLIDIVVATNPPVDSIMQSAEIATTPREDVWLLAGGTVTVGRDSAFLRVSGPSMHHFRVPPRAYIYRAEASAEGAVYAARATAPIDGGGTASTFPTSGFGMSDVLVATRAAARPAVATRWSELDIVPAVGAVPVGTRVTLVWESYDLAPRESTSEYSVTVTMTRTGRATGGRISAKIIGAVARFVGGSSSDDRLAITFDRSVPHQPIVLENVMIELGDSPSGNYRIVVDVLDRVTGRTVSRATSLVIGS